MRADLPPAVLLMLADTEVKLKAASDVLDAPKLTVTRRREAFRLLAGVVSNAEQLKLWLDR